MIPALLFAAALSSVPAAPAPAPQDAPAATDTPVARAGDQEFSRAEYADWLIQQYGVVHLTDFLTSRLLLRAADEQGLLPTDEEVAAAYIEEHDRIVEDYHRGDVERYHASLRARGHEPESYAAARRETLRVQLAHEALAVQNRVISDDRIAARFRDTYGAEPGQRGEHVVVDVLFFDMYATLERDGSPPDLGALKAEARARAELGRAELLAGKAPAELTGLSNPVPSEFAVDGRIAPYRKLLLGPEVERAVVSLDEVREQLRAELESFPPDSGDLGAVATGVLQQYEVEVLLR